jgi:protein-S-isoprenylcysteine O-methyltransferase Ste14
MAVSRLSLLLVFSQFVLIGYLGMTGPWLPANPGWLALLALGVMAALAASWAIRHSKLSVFAEPRPAALLVTDGIYAYLRHPYYTAVLCITFAWVGNAFDLYRLAAWLLLLVVLLVKIYFEEQLLSTHFEAYKDYQKKTWRIIPFVF